MLLYPAVSNKLQTVIIVPTPANQIPLLNFGEIHVPITPANTATTPTFLVPLLLASHLVLFFRLRRAAPAADGTSSSGR